MRGGVVIDMQSLHAVHSVSADRINVDAGASWRSVLSATGPRSLAPPVLPNYLGLTVGGTLSIGGIGPATYSHGCQADHVLELEVVTGEGRTLTCSEAPERELFEAALVGQGQCAIIVRAVMRLVPITRMIREYTLPYSDLTLLLQDLELIRDSDRVDGAVAVVAPANRKWTFALLLTRQFTPPALPEDAAITSGLQFIPGAAQIKDAEFAAYADPIPDVPFAKSRPDLGLLLPGASGASFLQNMLGRLNPEDLGSIGAMRVFWWKRDPFTRPLFRTPEDRTFIYVAILRAETSDPAVIKRMLRGNRTLFEENRTGGGTLHCFSALRLSRGDWRRQYGDHWETLINAKRAHDPDNVLASGPDIF